MTQPHDLDDFFREASKRIGSEYARISRRVREDPGTAGDQGEENWAELLRTWLPSNYRIVTKGRIIGASGIVSPQVDIIVLKPTYPPVLDSMKLYLSDGVAAAFECKLTLRPEHIQRSFETASIIKGLCQTREGTPYKELRAPLIYGVLAHSHSWKRKRAKPEKLIEPIIAEALKAHPGHPREVLDFICIADLSFWYASHFTLPGVDREKLSIPTIDGMFPEESKLTTFFMRSITGEFSSGRKEPEINPISRMLIELFSLMSWEDEKMRWLVIYFIEVIGATSYGNPEITRDWLEGIYTQEVQDKVANFEIRMSNLWKHPWDEWGFFI